MTEDVGTLIARLREATGGCRELSIAIPAAIGFVWNGLCTKDHPAGQWEHPDGATLPDGAFSESIDAALTLIPDGWRVTHAYGPPWHWSLTRNEPTAFVQGKSETPALALCIAALEARRQAP